MDSFHLLAAKLRYKVSQIGNENSNVKEVQQEITFSNNDIELQEIKSEQLRESERKNCKLQIQNDMLYRENSEIKLQCDKLNAQNTQKDAQITSLKEECRIANRATDSAKRNLEEKTREYKSYELYLKSIRGELDMLKSQLSKVHEAFAVNKEEMKSIVHERKEMEQKITEYDFQYKTLLKQKTAWETKEKQLIEELIDANKQNTLTCNQRDSITVRLSAATERSVRLQSAFEAINNQLQAEQKDNQNLLQLITEAELRAKIATDAIEISQKSQLQLQCRYDSLSEIHNKQLEVEEVKPATSSHDSAMETVASPLKNDQVFIPASNWPVKASNPTDAQLKTCTSINKSTTNRLLQNQSILDTSFPVNDNCKACKDPPFGLMVACVKCKFDFHSKCTNGQCKYGSDYICLDCKD